MIGRTGAGDAGDYGRMATACPPVRWLAMFVIDNAAADAIRQAYEQGGELSAAVELRRHFPGITDNAEARRCVRSIVQWRPCHPRLGESAKRGNSATRPLAPKG